MTAQPSPLTSSPCEIAGEVGRTVSETNWHIGERATSWMRCAIPSQPLREFARQVGIAETHAWDCYCVFDQFGESRDRYPNLTWQHFSEAVDWDDASDCLQWANSCNASPNQMAAYHRAMNTRVVA